MTTDELKIKCDMGTEDYMTVAVDDGHLLIRVSERGRVAAIMVPSARVADLASMLRRHEAEAVTQVVSAAKDELSRLIQEDVAIHRSIDIARAKLAILEAE